MSWIEGIGDEVPIFFLIAIVVIVLFMVLAWKSTDVPEASIPTTDSQPRFSVAADSNPEIAGELLTDHPAPPASPPVEPQPSASGVQLPEQEEEENKVKETKTRLTEDTLSSTEEPEDDTGNKIRRRILETTRAQEVILIRLKYLDDTQRTVESNMNTTLEEFKRIHFEAELRANKTVKLIYNGQVLSNETQTLPQLGLDNNCVVHCLIHQSRSNASPQPSTTSEVPPSNANHEIPQPQRENSTAEAGVDIGGLLLPLFGVILGLVWYCRIAYATHFTAAATTILVGLSGLCVLSVFIMWQPTMTADPTS